MSCCLTALHSCAVFQQEIKVREVEQVAFSSQSPFCLFIVCLRYARYTSSNVSKNNNSENKMLNVTPRVLLFLQQLCDFTLSIKLRSVYASEKHYWTPLLSVLVADSVSPFFSPLFLHPFWWFRRRLVHSLLSTLAAAHLCHAAHFTDRPNCCFFCFLFLRCPYFLRWWLLYLVSKAGSCGYSSVLRSLYTVLTERETLLKRKCAYSMWGAASDNLMCALLKHILSCATPQHNVMTFAHATCETLFFALRIEFPTAAS